jgi:asparagine synthase (glutamine-hydrolysing)
MCGIAGIISLNEVSDESISSMALAMNLRGPDGHGIWESRDKRVKFGHTRLSIIDLSENGSQPMCILNETYSITYNGEIYNSNVLREELIVLGATFKSKSDTEVILWGWYFWKQELLNKLTGMFSFALYNSVEEKLFLVRDRLGIKPLLYSIKSNQILFASSINALISSGEIKIETTKNRMQQFLSYGFFIQPNTILAEINSLMPGHFIEITKDLDMNFVKYWDLERDVNLNENLRKLNYNEQVLELRRLIENSCAEHMLSDAPLGVFLSGGVDSTSITAIMNKLSKSIAKSYTIGFESNNNESDETIESKLVSDFIKTEHTQFVLTGKDVLGNLDEFILSIDQPCVDGLNTYFVSKSVNNDVKVLLSGIGADELFGGYDSFLEISKIKKHGNLFDYLLAFINPFYNNRFTRNSASIFKNNSEIFDRYRKIFNDNEIGMLLNSKVSQNNIYWTPSPSHKDTDTLILDFTKFEVQHYLLNNLLRDTDALSMASSKEVRPVFLDHKIVEFALSLPSESKIRNGRTKSILKDAVVDLLPLGFTDAKKKGFTLPISYWINNELKSKIFDTFKSETANYFFNQNQLIEMLNGIDKPKNAGKIWMIFIFILWAQKNSLKIKN